MALTLTPESESEPKPKVKPESESESEVGLEKDADVEIERDPLQSQVEAVDGDDIEMGDVYGGNPQDDEVNYGYNPNFTGPALLDPESEAAAAANPSRPLHGHSAPHDYLSLVPASEED